MQHISTTIKDAIIYGLAVSVLVVFSSPVVKFFDWSLARQSPTIGIVMVTVASILVVIGAAQISNEHVFRKWHLQGVKWPTLFSVAFAWLSIVVFGGLTCALQRIGLVEVTPVVAHTDDCAGKYADFFLWHLLDSIPLINFTETLHWTNKYEYSDPVSGLLLLAFKVFVIVPVIGSFVAWNRIRRENQSSAHSTPVSDKTQSELF